MSVDTRPAPDPVEARSHTELVPVSAMLTALSIPAGTCAVPLGMHVASAPDWTAVVVLPSGREVAEWLDHIERWGGVRLSEPVPVLLASPADTPMVEAVAAWMGWRVLLRHPLPVPDLPPATLAAQLPEPVPAIVTVADAGEPPLAPPSPPRPVGEARADLPAVAGGDSYTGR